MTADNSFSRRDFLKVASLGFPILGSLGNPRLAGRERAEEIIPGRFALYEVFPVDIGILQGVSVGSVFELCGANARDSVLSVVVNEINRASGALVSQDRKYYARAIHLSGSEGEAEMPFVATQDSTGNVFRWSLWSLRNEGYQIGIPTMSEMTEEWKNSLAIPVAKIQILGGPMILGPIVGNKVEPLIRRVGGRGLVFSSPFPDLAGSGVPIAGGESDPLVVLP